MHSVVANGKLCREIAQDVKVGAHYEASASEFVVSTICELLQKKATERYGLVLVWRAGSVIATS